LPDSPQGFLKKIEFQLLLADLSFQLAYSLPGPQGELTVERLCMIAQDGDINAAIAA
jgi:hypothetical protein